MQVTEKLTQGLKREFQVLVPATELGAKVNERLVELKDRVRINGFRPGKVPVEHLRRVYGRAVMAEAIEAAVREANESIIADNGFTLALDPKVTMPSEEGEVKAMIEGRADLSYSVAMEILPKIELSDFSGIKLKRLVAEVAEDEIAEALDRIAARHRPFVPKGEGAKAEKGDKVTVSFTGTIEGVPFEGGSAQDVPVEIGSGGFLPGFEDQLTGIAAGETRTVTATFPPTYQAAHLAGKEASFEVAAQSVDHPGTVTLDDDFAKSLGLDSLAKLKDALKDQLAREHAAVTRQRVKRALLDALDERHQFDLPPTLVDQEFENVWRTILSDLASKGRTFENEGTTEEATKADYRKIAQRRVRLGLVIAEIGARNNIKVTDDEMSRAVAEQVRQYPGREQQIFEHYRKTPAAVAALRAPIFEEKVVDFLLELVKVDETTVPRAELYKDDDEATAP